MAKVSTSAYEAFLISILQHGKDIVVVNKAPSKIATAKAHAKYGRKARLHAKPIKRSDIKVLGKKH